MNSEPLVLLPGHMCDHRVFFDQIATEFKELEVFVPLITGLDSITEIAIRTLEACPKHFALAGHSMGGIVAMEMYRLAPGRVSRLALIATNHLAEKPAIAEIRRSRIKAVMKGCLKKVVRDEMKPSYLYESPYKDLYLKFIMVMAMDLGPEVFMQQSKALINRPDQTSTIENLKIPLALIYGEEDKLCPPEYHYAMKDLIPHAELFSIRESGHMVMLEEKRQFNQALKGWLTL